MNCNTSEPLGGSVPSGQPQTSRKADSVVVSMKRGSQKSGELDVWRFVVLILLLRLFSWSF